MDIETRVLSIITPVYGRSVEHLPEAYASLVDQHLPDGWSWEWLVQEDGDTGAVARAVAGLPRRSPRSPDERISPGSGRHGGPATARNLALGRGSGSLIKVLDADDQLTAGALARDIEILVDNRYVGWTTSGARDLLPDGTTVGFANDPAGGPVPRGSVLDFWLAQGYRLPVHPATLCIRRDLLLMLGGWMALPASEDTGLLVAASVLSDGYFIAESGLLYRVWPGQMTRHPAHTDPAERDARIAVIKGRALALRDATAARPR